MFGGYKGVLDYEAVTAPQKPTAPSLNDSSVSRRKLRGCRTPVETTNN